MNQIQSMILSLHFNLIAVKKILLKEVQNQISETYSVLIVSREVMLRVVVLQRKNGLNPGI